MKEGSTVESIYRMVKKEVLHKDNTCANLMGPCSDEASNLRSNGPNSLVALLNKEFPYIWSFHDVSHRLNLVCKKSLEILPKDISEFLN